MERIEPDGARRATQDPLRLAFLGTYPPRKCGIATFTRDLSEAAAGVRDDASIRVLAVTDSSGPYDYQEVVRFEVRQGVKQDYIRAAEQINYSDVQFVYVQHEFGIYGGNDGAHLLAFLAELRKPVAATLHTVLNEPSASQRSIVRRMAERCDRLIVMSHLAADRLVKSHGIPGADIQVIPHGIPDLPRGDQVKSKTRFGVAGRRMLLTFGLLSPNKGIETVLRAMPRLTERFPDLVYFVVGATHPNVQREHGEEYRISLEHLAKQLGLVDHVVFRDEFVSTEELADLLRATDVYVTPYLNEAQSTSGTLSYAMGAGTAVVSTPYWHAQEFLADGRGRMFDFGDSEALADVVEILFSHPGQLRRVREAAWQFTRSMAWPRVGEAYVALAERIVAETPVDRPRAADAERLPVPELRLDHLVRMTDDTGILQHATYSVPARRTGYCVDDNARALIVALLAYRVHESPHTAGLITKYLSYLEFSQTENGHFRNFLDYARRFDTHGESDDCAGRALWALGVCTQLPPEPGIRSLAHEMFERAMALAPSFGLRGQAFALIGLDAFLTAEPDHVAARQLVETLSSDLIRRYGAEADAAWRWFEPDLTYDNAMVPLALFKAFRVTGEPDCLAVARASLGFLEEICFTDQYLSLVGNEGWHRRGGTASVVDEQPIDAAAFVMAFREAYLVTSDDRYLSRMRESFEWFLGRNRLGLPLYNFTTAGCHDALALNGVNRNQGAESSLSFLLSLLTTLEVVGLELVERSAMAWTEDAIGSLSVPPYRPAGAR